MNPEIASIHDRMAQGGDWRGFQQEISRLHEVATTKAEYVTLLEAHANLIAVAEHAFDAETHAKILPIARSEYLMFLNKEAMENGSINPALLDRITRREVEAGRLAPDDDFRSLAAAGGAVLGDSASLHVPRTKRGDYFFYGTAMAAVLAMLLASSGISPLWLILLGLGVGWYINDRERKQGVTDIVARRT